MKTVDVSDSVVASDIKVDLCNQLNELLNIPKSKSFIDLHPGCLWFSTLTASPLKLLGSLKHV